MPHPAEHSPLGKTSDYPDRYSPELLYPIARASKWAELGISAQTLPYQGVDVWNCYELSWLLPSGKPVVAMAAFFIPANSPNIIESKSFKLYLNSFNQAVFASFEDISRVLARDLSKVAGAQVRVELNRLSDLNACAVSSPEGECIDELEINISAYHHPDASLLRLVGEKPVARTFHSNLLKSNCPVTGQPDWGTVVVSYNGPELCQASFLAYLVSFRQHQDFHEQCVERIFLDLHQLLTPEQLTVYARYVRRGGLDINPYRSTEVLDVINARLARQ